MKKEMLERLEPYFNIPKIVETYDSDKFYAVRSNDLTEDTEEKSSAGKYKTILNVKGDKVEEAIEDVLKTASDCFVQEMIIPDYSFVGLMNKKLGKVIISMNNGPCEALTSGLVTGVSLIETNDSKRVIGKQEKKLVFSGTRPIFIEDLNPKFFNIDFYIIWAYMENVARKAGLDSVNIEGSVCGDKIYLLQCRPWNI